MKSKPYFLIKRTKFEFQIIMQIAFENWTQK